MDNYPKTAPVRIEPPHTLKETDRQYGRVFKRLINITEQLKSTRSYLAEKLFVLTGQLPPVLKEDVQEEEFVPLVDDLDKICDDLNDINKDINYILDRTEL